MKLDAFRRRGTAVSSLIDDFKNGRFPSGLLIAGESGTGKKTLAGLLAQTLLCSYDGERPCGKCKGCRRMEDGTHPDLLTPQETKKASIGVDELRRIIDTLSRHAFEGGMRVVLIREAQRMTVSAQNSLLKSIEEADGNTCFILVSDQEAAILPTIRSRCRVLHIGAMRTEEIAAILENRCGDSMKAAQAAEDSGGSIGKALQLLDDDRFWQARNLCEETFIAAEGVSGIPFYSKKLVAAKDSLSLLLDVYERFLRKCSAKAEDAVSPWNLADEASLIRLRTGVIEARKKLAANVGWAAVAEELLLDIIKEKKAWQK